MQVQLDLPSPARVLLNGRVSAIPEELGSSFKAGAACRWGGVQESGDVFVNTDDQRDMSLVGLTNVLPAGQGYTFAIECRDWDTPHGVYYVDAWITAVAISPS